MRLCPCKLLSFIIQDCFLDGNSHYTGILQGSKILQGKHVLKRVSQGLNSPLLPQCTVHNHIHDNQCETYKTAPTQCKIASLCAGSLMEANQLILPKFHNLPDLINVFLLFSVLSITHLYGSIDWKHQTAISDSHTKLTVEFSQPAVMIV